MERQTSKTVISRRIERKMNPSLANAAQLAKKHNMIDLAFRLSGPTRNHISINVEQLNEIEEDKIVIIGRVLGQGEISNKKTIYALGFSEQAKEKLKKAGCEMISIEEGLKHNKLKGVKVL